MVIGTTLATVFHPVQIPHGRTSMHITPIQELLRFAYPFFSVNHEAMTDVPR